MADPAALPTQNAVDRARNQGNRIFQRVSELRRLQTERQIRTDSFPAGTSFAGFGLASYRQISASIIAEARGKLTLRKVGKLDNLEALINRAHGIGTATEITKQSQSIPGNAPAPAAQASNTSAAAAKTRPQFLPSPPELHDRIRSIWH